MRPGKLRPFYGVMLGLLFQSLAFAGATEAKLSDLAIGATPEDIIAILGQPDIRREEGKNVDGKTVERFRYRMTRRLKSPTASGDLEETYICSLIVIDGKLARIDREL